MDTLHDAAPLYALGALEGEELALFEAHLRSGCDPCRTALQSYQWIIDHLIYSLDPMAPPPEVRRQLLAQIGEETAAAAADRPPGSAATARPAFVSLRAGAGSWAEVAPGIRVQALYTHGRRGYATTLVRLAPGTSYPRHRHLDTEELFILEGHCQIDGQRFGPGDYHRAEGESVHQVTHTEGGCLLLVVASGGGHTFE